MAAYPFVLGQRKGTGPMGMFPAHYGGRRGLRHVVAHLCAIRPTVLKQFVIHPDQQRDRALVHGRLIAGALVGIGACVPGLLA
ncbi:hypothetical protein D3C86_1950410 [compost metagenome]